MQYVLAMSSNITKQAHSTAQAVWLTLLAAVMATLVGIGLARFAFTPLIPVLIEAGWFSASDALYLGAANLLGYFLGALSANRLTERFEPRAVVGLCLATIVLSFFLCAWPAGFYWFFWWRLLSGFSGAVLMVTVPSMALSQASLEQRAMVGTLSFAGIGLGVVLAAFVVPLLLTFSLTVVWLALGVVGLGCALACDLGMRQMQSTPVTILTDQKTSPDGGYLSAIVILVLIAYALDAAGFIPHTVFWVDFLARENGFGQAAASLQWGVFGLGALCGPFIARGLVARLGWGRSLALVLAIKAVAIAMPLLSLTFVSQTLSSFLVGALVPGVTALTSGRLAEAVGSVRHKQVWGYATAAFAAAQAVSGYGMSAAYDAIGTYAPLYATASGLLMVAAVLVLAGNIRTTP